MKGRSVAGLVAGLLLAGAAGAVLGRRRKQSVAVPVKPVEKAEPQESPEHLALREILELSVAYNEALLARLGKLEEITDAGALPAAVEVLSETNREARREIDALRASLQAHLESREMRFSDIDGFVELLSRFRAVTLEQQEKHLAVYRRVQKMPGMPYSDELHAYLKLGFNDEAQKHADTDEQMRQATAEQREIMLRVGRLLAEVVDAESAESVPEELLKISARYQRLTERMRWYREDDAAGAAEALAALKSMYAALTPPLKERASQLRHVGCYGNKQLYEILERLLPEKRSN